MEAFSFCDLYMGCKREVLTHLSDCAGHPVGKNGGGLERSKRCQSVQIVQRREEWRRFRKGRAFGTAKLIRTGQVYLVRFALIVQTVGLYQMRKFALGAVENFHIVLGKL